MGCAHQSWIPVFTGMTGNELPLLRGMPEGVHLFKEPCPYPVKARMSLESIAIDVIGLLDHLGLESEFRPDRIKWTGCVMF